MTRGHGPRRGAHRRRPSRRAGRRRIWDLILAVASGRQTVSEELDLGQDEFVPWQLGAVT